MTDNAHLQNWGTPQWLFDRLHREFGFTLDVCSEPWSAKCASFYTEADNGLAMPWYGRVWYNPPYNDPAPWIYRALEARHSGVLSVGLIPSNTETAYFHDAAQAAQIRLLRRRLTYAPPHQYTGELFPARFPSCVVIIAPRESWYGRPQITTWDPKEG